MTKSSWPGGRHSLMGIAAASLLFAGCGENPSRALAEMEPQFDHAELSPVSLGAEIVVTGDVLGIPVDLAYVDGWLAVSDRATDEVLHVISAVSGDHQGSFGRRGQGPGEFTSAPRLVKAPEGGARIYAYDVSQNRLTRFALPRGEVLALAGRISMSLPVARTVYGLALPDSTSAVGLGFFEHGRLALSDLIREETTFAGPVPGNGDAPPNVLQHAYQAEVTTHPDGTRYIVATRHAGQVEVFDGNGERLRVATGPYEFDPDYVVRGRSTPRYVAGLRTRYGYLDLAATDDRVFALFSGRAEGHYRSKGASPYDGEFIHVFDWMGNFVEAFRLDREVFRIAVGNDGRTIYGLTETPVPEVLAFRLPTGDDAGPDG